MKSSYCYDYMDSIERFHETSLPPREAFFNSLNEEELLESDYQHAQTVWETFDIQNLCQYHDFYVSLDVLIFADVFENVRDVCLDYYELDQPTSIHLQVLHGRLH